VANLDEQPIQARYEESVRELMADIRRWRPIHESATEVVEFLIDGQHFEDDDGRYSKSSTEIRWCGEESFHRWRHEIGVVTETGTLVARPVDMDGTPAAAELAANIVQSDIDRPEKEFEDNNEGVVGAASAIGYGVGWLDYIPDWGPYGNIFFVADDPRNFMCDTRAKSVHSPFCRHVRRRLRLTKAELLRRCEGPNGWNRDVVERMQPDDGDDSKVFKIETSPGFVLKVDGGANDDVPDEDKHYTVFITMYRRSDDKETHYSQDYLEPGDRYLRCTTCNYRTESQSVMGQELPDALEASCPRCMDSPDPTLTGDMERVDFMEQSREMLAYPEGKVCVIAPFAGVSDYLYEGPPQFKLRSFPVMFLSRFMHPFYTTGPGIGMLAWYNQTATDMLMRLALERIVDSAPRWMTPDDGIDDVNGLPYTFAPDNGNIMIYRTSDGAPNVQFLGGEAGIPQAWGSVIGVGRASLTGHTGIADFSLSEGQSRDIPASSVALQVQQEEVPVAHFKRRYQRQRSILMGVYYDMLRATRPWQDLYRTIGPDGLDKVQAVAAGDLPNFDFHYSDSPDFSPKDQARAAGLNLVMQAIVNAPWSVDLIADANKVPPSIVRRAKFAFQQYQQQQAQAALNQLAGGAAPGMGQPQPGQPAGSGGQQEPSSAVVARLLDGLRSTQGSVA